MITIYDDVAALRAIKAKYHLSTPAAIRVGELVHVGGLAALDPRTGECVGGDIRRQADSVLSTLDLVLTEIGLGLDHVVTVNATLADPVRDFAGWNAAFQRAFRAPRPVRTTVGGTLVVGLLEVELCAATRPRTG
ncbi:RidA family protein [Goodfellowiella coeruleoviolacea]|uniref:2-iminobutanoate/2-iminopropanoate deaminase n=1 Tax=Goodfellowiella coeruleoviolacea TaxID=334858 RepID=A0AAE3GNM7_9PSEU|nr:Rid family hydrolase [Goodfellowiella coeruleoviolacea]MCP2169333.1 2-iminobutanoate/2-iminopropanoate deaminase [Goodfellowiella coeruleoviolacea]